MKYLITTLAIIAFNVHANDHKNLPKPSECKGSPANYYVAKLIEGGSLNGWLKATKMHEAYYQDRGFDVKVVPSIQYLPNEENGGPSDDVFRISTHVIYKNVSEVERWSEWNNTERTESDEKDYDAFVAEYDKNNEVTAKRFLCMLKS
ncbi:MAG: hypothetical protein EBX13_05190 [Proteobacteria bacterium]|nr:hypothetical protein [Pseudomonadota bacterium]NCX25152.1 hypothetical protein [Pseudomonadota bacterium]